jgi:hypothetical protein
MAATILQFPAPAIAEDAYRSVARLVMLRYAEARETQAARDNRQSFDLPLVEFCVDVERVARLTMNRLQWEVFRGRHIDELDSKTISRRLGLSTTHYFQHLYRAEFLAGKAFVRTEPYALYPTSSYFGLERIGVTVCKKPEPAPVLAFPQRNRLRRKQERAVAA